MKMHRHGFMLFTLLFTTMAMAEDAVNKASNDEAIKKDHQLMAGTWRIVSVEVKGTKIDDGFIDAMRIVNGDDGTWSLQLKDGQVAVHGTSVIDPSQSPKTIDFKSSEGESKDLVFQGIYELEENTRKLCYDSPENDRPTEFSSTPENGYVLVIFERMKPE